MGSFNNLLNSESLVHNKRNRMKTSIFLVLCFVVFANAASIKKDYADKYCNALAKQCKAGNKEACELYEKKCGKDLQMTCDDLAKKCKAGDKKACALYKKKCGKSMMAVDESKMTCDDLAKKCKAGDKKACEIYKEKCGKDEKMTCDDLAKKCKAGDKKACEVYKEKCGKDDGKEFCEAA